MLKRLCEVGEHPNGIVTKIESKDVDFLENNFLSMGVMKDLKVYKIGEAYEYIRLSPRNEYSHYVHKTGQCDA